MAADLQAFGAALPTSAWWTTVRGGDCVASLGPCVGTGTSAFIALSTQAAATYTDSVLGGDSSLQTWLAAAIAAGQLPSAAAGALSNSVYVLYLPATTTITLDGVTSCSSSGFAGYHNVLPLGAQQVPYVVVVECPPAPPMFQSAGALTALDIATVTASHEIIETATDPVATKGYALDGTVFDNWGWIDVTGGGEIADMCYDALGLNQDVVRSGPYAMQRAWSLERAAAGADPCVPAPAGDVYFNAAPRRSFFVLDVGASATFEVDAFAYQPMGGWTLAPTDFSDSPDTYLTFAIEGGTDTSNGPQIAVRDGDAVRVTVTLVKDPGGLDVGEADGALISFAGDAAAPTAAHYWAIAVMSSADAQDAGIPAGTTRRHNPARDRRAPLRRKRPPR
jgi:hypothetical protein